MSDFQIFIDLIKSGSDEEIENKFKNKYLEMTDNDLWRPLHYACRYGRVGLVELLFINFCRIDPSTNIGCQPIHLACKNGHIDIVNILIVNKCDINASDENGYQPIHLACENGHIDVVKLLIENKCDLNASDNKGYQPIHLACMNGHIEIVKILISKKCDINACNYYGYRPIHYASKNGHIGIVKMLIAKQCDINVYDKTFGDQPIHFASKNGHIDVVKILIANNCDVNAYDKTRGYQPLHLACFNGHIDIVKILIENNCDINSLSKNGKSAIDIARQEGYQDIINIINSKNPIESIAKAMNLQCSINCDHKFCRKTLNQEEIKGGVFVGKGGFGEVYKYRISNTDREIVIKQNEYDCEDKYIEGNINKYSSIIIHENIVRYFGALEKSGKLWIFMEFVPGGSLQDLVKKAGIIEINKGLQYCKQILVGLQFLHSKSIIHRDIKPPNILLDHDEKLKLADFGISRTLQNSLSESRESAHTYCGTPNYMAPEVILEKPYSYAADIWSTGVTIVYMITGKVPFRDVKSNEYKNMIGTTKKMEFSCCQRISETIKSFIEDFLTVEQSLRPSADVLLKNSIFKDVR